MTARVRGLRCSRHCVASTCADLGRADAEGERAEGAVRAGVAVAADDRHARLRAAELRPDHVHDAAPRVAEAEQLDAVRARVLAPARRPAPRPRHRGSVCRRGAAPARVGVEWSSVPRVRSGPAHGEAARLELREGLRRRDLVDEVQVDVEHRRRLRPSPARLRAACQIFSNRERGFIRPPACGAPCALPRRARSG